MKFLSRADDAVATPRGAALLIGATLLSMFVFRALLFPGMGGDDGEQLLFAQYFDWGYQVRNPPLYTWLVMLSGQVFGTTQVSVFAVKFSLLAASYYLLWGLGTRMLEDRRLAALAAASPLALYYVAWDAVNGYSHSILVMTAYLATLLVLLRIERRGSLVDFALLGAVAGIGLLSKYAYALFLLALILAALSDREWRETLLSWKLLLSAIIAAVTAVPHGLWLIEHLPAATEAASTPFLESLGRSLKNAARLLAAVAGFLAPLWLVLFALFPGAIRTVPDSGSMGARHHRLLRRGLLILLVIALIAILGFTSDRLRTHYLFVLVPFPLFFLLKVKAARADPTAMRRYGVALALFAFVAVAAMAAKYVAEPLKCTRCQHHIAYTDIADRLRAEGFTGGTIIAYWHPDPIAGNLKDRFPTSRVISTKHPTIVPPQAAAAGQCLLAWPGTQGDAGKHATIRFANRAFGVGLEQDVPADEISVPLAMGYGKTWSLGYVLLDPGRGDCR